MSTMARPGPDKKTSKGRQKIEYRRIENKARRQATQCKRKGGIFKKGSELRLLCGADVAVVVFSKKQMQAQGDGVRVAAGGNVFAMGTPSVDHVLRRFAALPGRSGLEDAGAVAAERAAVEARVREVKETEALVKAEEARMQAIEHKVLQAVEAAGRRFWWEVDVEALGEAELPEFARALQRLRDSVQLQANQP